MDFRELIKDRRVLVTIIAGVLLVLVLMGFLMAGNSSSGGRRPEKEKILKEVDLLTVDNIGKALEIQALLAKQGIEAERVAEGTTKSRILLRECTVSERDRALLAIVNSGLMDKNIGLEVFDKGDFTSTREDKRIRLVRAINGELSRLIRHIEGIEDASVFVSVPEPTMFSEYKKPTTATVQLVIPSGEKLDKTRIRAVMNLLLGSVPELEAKNVSITDTNGNVYSNIDSAEYNMMEKTEERDQYMEKNVQEQLDKLLGKGTYVVTVSTFLRENPEYKQKVLFDPNSKAVMNEQTFSEGLGDQATDSGKMSSAVSTYLPAGLPQSSQSSTSKSYRRTAQDRQYGVSKVESYQNFETGAVEEISVAVTLDRNSMPSNMSIEELKEFIARAASPKVNPDSVEIAFSSDLSPMLAEERDVQLPRPDGGNPWWVAAGIFLVMLVSGLIYISKKVNQESILHQEKIDELERISREQERQLRDTQSRTAAMIAQQQQLREDMLSSTDRVAISTKNAGNIGAARVLEDELQDDMDEEEVSEKLRSWIESND